MANSQERSPATSGNLRRALCLVAGLIAAGVGVMAASFGDTWSPQLYEFFESIDLYNRIDSFMPYFPLVPFYPLILMVLGTYLIVKSRS